MYKKWGLGAQKFTIKCYKKKICMYGVLIGFGPLQNDNVPKSLRERGFVLPLHYRIPGWVTRNITYNIWYV